MVVLYRLLICAALTMAAGNEAWGGEWMPDGPVLVIGASYELNLWDMPNVFCEDGSRLTGMLGIRQTVYRKGHTSFNLGYAHDSCLAGANDNDRNVFDRVTMTMEVRLW